jgi:GR25 family glycosyltransferase involved in LPS biosynthesis
LKAIKIACDKGDEEALIMEDDMRIDFINKWEKSIEEIVRDKPNDAECIILHCSGRKHILKMLLMNCDYAPWIKGRWSCGSYYITRKGMEKIIKLGDNFIPKTYYPSDHLIYKLIKSYNYTKPLFNSLNIEKSLVINHSRVLNLMPVFRRYFDKINIINKLKNDNVNKTKAFLVNLHKLKNEKNNIRKNLIRKRIKVILIKRKNNILRIRKIFK